MTYIPFALKYRPQRFEEILGQEHVSRTLMNAVAQGRVARGYIFAGPRGTGKTSTARILAKALNCEQGPTAQPCGECSICQAIQNGHCMDVREIDAASNRGIDEIRDLREKIKYSPAEARYKVYILDEAHMLTDAASNALLKTLEEPPEHAYFVLATTEPHQLLPTILSRCQRFDFRPIPVGLMIEGLQRIAQEEDVQIDEAALAAIAQAADGAMRNAESIFDQVVAYTDKAIDVGIINAVLGVTEAELLVRVGELIAAGDVPGLFGAVDELVTGGKDLEQFLADLTVYFRDLLRISMGAEPAIGRQLAEGEGPMRRQAQQIGSKGLLATIHTLAEAQQQLKHTSQQALLVELTLAKVAEAQPTQTRATPVATEKPTTPTTPAPSTPPEGPLTLETMQTYWQQVPEQLKRMGHMPVGAIVKEARPVALEDDRLVVAFDEQQQFHYNRAREQYREIIEDAIEKLVGRRLTMQCRLGAVEPAAEPSEPADSGTQPEVSSTPPESAAPSEESMQQVVDRTLELFEGSTEITEE